MLYLGGFYVNTSIVSCGCPKERGSGGGSGFQDALWDVGQSWVKTGSSQASHARSVLGAAS